MLRRRVAGLHILTTPNHTHLRMGGWTLTLRKPSSAGRTMQCTYLTKTPAGWARPFAQSDSRAAEQHQDASPDIYTRKKRSI